MANNVPLRVVGVSGGGRVGSQQRSENPQLAQSANPMQAEQRLQNAAKYTDVGTDTAARAFDIAKQGAQIQQQLAAQSGGRGNGLANAIGAIAQVATAFGEMRQRRQEMAMQIRDEEEQRRNDEEYVFALNEAQGVLEQARSIINEEGYEAGVPMVRRRVNRILSQYRHLNPETVAQISKSVYGELDNINASMWSETQRQKREADEAYAATVLEQGKFSVAHALERVANSGDMIPLDRQLEIVNEAIAAMTGTDAFRALPEQVKLETLRGVYAHARGYLEEGSQMWYQMDTRERRVTMARSELQQVEALYAEGLLTFEQRAAEVEKINAQYGINAQPVTVQDELNDMLSRQETYSAFLDFERQQIAENAPAPAQLEVGHIVANSYLNGGDLSMIPEGPLRDDVERIRKVYDQLWPEIQTRQDRLVAIDEERHSLRTQIRMGERAEQLLRGAEDEEERNSIIARLPSEDKRAWNNLTSLRAEAEALGREAQRLNQDLTTYQRQLQPYGLHLGWERQGDFYNSDEAQASREAAIEAQAQQRAEGVGSFSYGDVAQTAPPRPLARLGADQTGHVEAGSIEVPFVPREGVTYNITSGFHAHPGGRDRHRGIDFAPTSDPNGTHHVAAIRSGRVVFAGVGSGWGNYVAIEDQNGQTAIYAHLRQHNVQVGDIVSQGTPIGIMGNSGESRGAHLHLSVLTDTKGGTVFAEANGVADPLEYIRQTVPENNPVPRGLGLPPTQGTASRAVSAPPSSLEYQVATTEPPPGAFILPDGNGYLYGNTVYFETEADMERARSRSTAARSRYSRTSSGVVITSPGSPGVARPTQAAASQVFHGANPQANYLASNDRADYRPGTINNPENNFGYEALASDNAFRMKLHQTAAQIGVPTQWLADIMAFETGGTFSPGIRNGGGAPAVGLIQFYEDENDPGHKTIRGRRYSLRQIASMTRTEQLDLVRDYFWADRGNFDHMHELLMYVWGGPGRAFRNPADMLNIGDGDTTFGQYLQRVGEHVGRRYYTPADAVWGNTDIHTAYNSSCATCQSLRQNGQNIIAHMAS